MKRLIVGAAAAIALAVAGCKGEPSASSARLMSTTERQALTATLSSSPQMGQFGPIASAALVYVSEVGQVVVTTGTTSAAYNAVGLWMDINVTHGQQPVVSQFFTVLVWQGTGQSIQKIGLVLGAGNTAPTSVTLGATFNGTSGGTGMFGNAPFDASAVYVAASGTFSVSGVSFTGAASFSQGTLTGSYSNGTLMGTYSFLGINSSATSVTQSTDFSSGIPAVHLVVNGTF